MSRAKHPPSDKFNALASEAAALNESHDCAVKAVCVVTGAPYREVHELFTRHGREFRDGAYFHITKTVLRDLGYTVRKWSITEMVDMIYSYPNYQVLSITLRHPSLFPEQWAGRGPLLMRTRNHVTGFFDGQIHDHMTRLRSRVYEIYDVLNSSGAQRSVHACR